MKQMRLNAFLWFVIALSPAVAIGQTQKALEGCVDPRTIAAVIGKLQHTNSRPFSMDQLWRLWPYEMSEVETTATNRTLESEDRILKGECQCCTSFLFFRNQKDREAQHKLYSVIVNYTARRREDLLAIAKMFERAIGLGTAKFSKVVSASYEDYDWETNNENERRLYTIEIRFARRSGLWKMYFRTAYYVVEP